MSTNTDLGNYLIQCVVCTEGDQTVDIQYTTLSDLGGPGVSS